MKTRTSPGYTQGGCRRPAGCGTHTAPSQQAGRERRWKGLGMNWLRVLGTADLPHIDQGVRQSWHAKVSWLQVFKTKQQPIERILPRKGPIDASPQGMESDV